MLRSAEPSVKQKKTLGLLLTHNASWAEPLTNSPACMYVHIYIHAYTDIHTYTYTDIHMHACELLICPPLPLFRAPQLVPMRVVNLSTSFSQLWFQRIWWSDCVRIVARNFVPFAHAFCHLTCVRTLCCVEPFGGCVAYAGVFLSLFGVALANKIRKLGFWL